MLRTWALRAIAICLCAAAHPSSAQEWLPADLAWRISEFRADTIGRGPIRPFGTLDHTTSIGGAPPMHEALAALTTPHVRLIGLEFPVSSTLSVGVGKAISTLPPALATARPNVQPHFGMSGAYHPQTFEGLVQLVGDLKLIIGPEAKVYGFGWKINYAPGGAGQYGQIPIIGLELRWTRRF